MKQVADDISGYSYGAPDVGQSAVSMRDLDDLKRSPGFTEDDERYLRLAGEVLADQTKQIVEHWRGGILRASRTSRAIPARRKAIRTRNIWPGATFAFSSGSWTCLRPYDQDWINYQQEIALRHTAAKKNKVDGARSTPFVPSREVLTFVAVMNITMKRYLAAKGHPAEVVDKMHDAGCKSMQLQLALWIGPYADTRQAPREW